MNHEEYSLLRWEGSVCTDIFYLARRDGDRDTAIGKWERKKSFREAARKLQLALRQLSVVGVEMFEQDPGKCRRIDERIIEVKVERSVVRALCYNRRGKDLLVVLEVFMGHQGSGNIQREIDSCRRLIPVVERLLGDCDLQERAKG